MTQSIAQIYSAIIEKCSLLNAPRLEIKPLKAGEAARYGWTTVGKGFKTRTVDQSISFSPEYASTLDEEQITLILAHELAHWMCHWHCISGGDATADGDDHGARFLAAWLSILKRLGKSDVDLKDHAHWHAQAYSLNVPDMNRALNAAIATENAPDAIHTARPPRDRRAEALFWLRTGGWAALAFALIAVIWNSPLTAMIGIGMTLACYVLINKVKQAPESHFSGA